MNAALSASDRLEVREAVKSEREERRAALKRVVDLAPDTRLGRKAGVLFLDASILEDKILECGGDAGLEFVLFAQVASGVRLRDWAQEYGIERGLLWAWVSETEERLQRYYRALRGVADEYVSEVVGIADGSSDETHQTDKLRADMRLKVAEKYDQPRFGRQTKVTHELGVDFGERLRRAQERVIEGRSEVVEDAVLVAPYARTDGEPAIIDPDQPIMAADIGTGARPVEAASLDAVDAEVVTEPDDADDDWPRI